MTLEPRKLWAVGAPADGSCQCGLANQTFEGVSAHGAMMVLGRKPIAAGRPNSVSCMAAA
jgi:hypothetical protein